MRIELTERYVSHEDRDLYEKLGLDVPPGQYRYRRIYPMLHTIEYPIEIPDDTEHCEVLFKDDFVVVVKGSFDDLCILIDDRESQEYGED